jgi:hypothetical protein
VLSFSKGLTSYKHAFPFADSNGPLPHVDRLEDDRPNGVSRDLASSGIFGSWTWIKLFWEKDAKVVQITVDEK